MGTLKATLGSVRVCGLDAFADSISVKSRVGFLPDEPVFFDYMRGREIVRFAGQLHGLDRAPRPLPLWPPHPFACQSGSPQRPSCCT
jgi:ABC-type multidrug transport system ATPase subunit